MRILALEPYYGGSHRAFLDGWLARSGHEFTLLGLPAYKWKWRMRHAAVTFAEMVAEHIDQGERWDAIFCSDMLNLPEFRGLTAPHVASLPAVVYFHENQLTYPQQRAKERDLHFAYTNITTAHAAEAVWFNSVFHRDIFLEAAATFLQRMPDYSHANMIDDIRDKAVVHSPGIREFPARNARRDGPLRILWAARWEHDKNPGDFFAALEILERSGIDFRLSVIGESFAQVPDVFADARRRFADRIDRWGYQASREEYVAALLDADVAVSTAVHEFFGIGILEAVAAGAFPVVPRRLAYPETLAALESDGTAAVFFDGTVSELADRLQELAARLQAVRLWGATPDCGRLAMRRYHWDRIAVEMDAAMDGLR